MEEVLDNNIQQDEELKATKKKALRIMAIILAFIILIVGLFIGFVANPYKPDDYAKSCLTSTDNVTVTYEDKCIIFTPKKSIAGLIFYPGAKIECEAYAPLMQRLAEQNITCVLCDMALNLAFFDMELANPVMDLCPDVTSWYIAGHSLGGVMASFYINRYPEYMKGIIFLASYPGVPLTDYEGGVLSIYGSEDGILVRNSYNKMIKETPVDFREVVIYGGNHSNFGYYGDQEGDNEAFINRETQQFTTATEIHYFISLHETISVS